LTALPSLPGEVTRSSVTWSRPWRIRGSIP